MQWSAYGGATSAKASCREVTSVSSEQDDVLENVLLSPSAVNDALEVPGAVMKEQLGVQKCSPAIPICG